MENLKEEIGKNLKELENIIKIGKERSAIEKQRKELDKLLEKYLEE